MELNYKRRERGKGGKEEERAYSLALCTYCRNIGRQAAWQVA
jgi:hypothetical protein